MEKNKIKLYIYPQARGHVHDDPYAHHVNGVSQYINTVPLSKQGVEDHFQLVSPDKAEYFYTKSAEKGNGNAQYNLSQLCLKISEKRRIKKI